MTETLRFKPLQTGYTAEEMPGVVHIPLEGGPGRKKQDILFPGHIVNCQWLLKATEYTEFMGFFTSELRYGRDDFFMDVITDIGVPTTHLCRTIGGVPKLIRQSGDGYWASCVIECDKNPTYTSTITYKAGSTPSWTFDGIDDLVDFGNVLDFERTDAFSLSAWVTPPSLQTVSRKIFEKTSPDINRRGYHFYFRDGGVPSEVNDTVMFELNNINNLLTNSLKVYANNTFTDQNLHHLVVTYDGSSSPSGVKIYFDGVAQSTFTFSNTLTGTTVSTSDLEFGNRLQGIARHGTIWNTDLSPAEVTELYNSGTPGDPTAHSAAANLVLWIKVDGTDTTDPGGVIDHSSSGFDGTAEGGLGTDSSGPTEGQIIFTDLTEKFQEGDQIRVLFSNGIHPTGSTPLNLDGIYTVDRTIGFNVVILENPALVNTDWATLFSMGALTEYGNPANGNVTSTVTKVPT